MSDTVPGLTLTFPHVVAKRHAEVAIDRERERQETARTLAGMCRLAPKERLGHHLELGDATYVVEVVEGEDSTWGVVRSGRMDYRRFFTVDEALLLAVELRNGGRANDQGHVYAARMLGVVQPATEETP